MFEHSTEYNQLVTRELYYVENENRNAEYECQIVLLYPSSDGWRQIDLADESIDVSVVSNGHVLDLTREFLAVFN